jgi:hypothetical protein
MFGIGDVEGRSTKVNNRVDSMNRLTNSRILEDELEELQPTRIPFVSSLPAAATNFGNQTPRSIQLSGHTRSVSLNELELIAPFILFTTRSRLGKDSALQISLTLPAGSISFCATVVSYTQLDEFETGVGYLITAQNKWDNNDAELNCVIRARITSISEKDRQQLVKYLRSLSQTQLEQTVLVMEGNGTWREQLMTVTVMA